MSEEIVRSAALLVLFVLIVHEVELELEGARPRPRPPRLPRLPIARLVKCGVSLTLVGLLFFTGGCGDNSAGPELETPSCADLGCTGAGLIDERGGLVPLCSGTDTDPTQNGYEETACACDGIACEPRAFDCCETYMPDGIAVGACGALHIAPGTCDQLLCFTADRQFSTLVMFCRPEQPQ